MKLEDLKREHIKARKDKNMAVNSLISMLIANLESKDKKGKTLMDKKGESYAILEMLKDTRNNNRLNLNGLIEKGGNGKLIDDLTVQNAWIDKVLPMLSDDELESIVLTFIQDNALKSAKQLPQVIKYLKTHYLFRYDSRKVENLVASRLP